MKVDMSPKAVTARLKTLDELWELSMKLMNSKKIKPVKSTEVQLTRKSKTKQVVRKDKSDSFE